MREIPTLQSDTKCKALGGFNAVGECLVDRMICDGTVIQDWTNKSDVQGTAYG